MNKELFFSTAIHYFDFPESASLNAFLKSRIYSWRELDGIGIERSNARQTGAWHSATDMNRRLGFELFLDKIQKSLDQVFKEQHYDSGTCPYIVNMWANINPPGGYNRGHTHPGALLSGVYYVQAPTECGRLLFQDPRAQALVIPPKFNDEQSLNAESWSQVFYEAIEGRLIIFPSWLQHEVEPNSSPLSSPHNDRISISFNVAQQAVKP